MDKYFNLSKENFIKEQFEPNIIILKFSEKPNITVRNFIKNQGVKWNKVRGE